MEYTVGVKCRLDTPEGRPLLGAGRARLLSLIEELGSIAAAAKEMGMSYRYAWGMLRRMDGAAGAPLVSSARGGRRGGRTTLTPLGRELLNAYRRVEDTMEEEARRGAFPHPRLAVDVVAERDRQVVLVRRGRPPFLGRWALPGGFVDRGERLEDAALRELEEETGLGGRVTGLVGAYSRPDRDPRGHTVSVVYSVEVLHGTLRGGDDAAEAAWHPRGSLPELAFDHTEILRDHARRGHLRISKEE